MSLWAKPFARAVSLFRRFHEREPASGEIATVKVSEPVFLVGELDTIRYKVAKQPELWEHKFAENSRPLIYSSSDGRRVFILKGRWTFTERGFVNR